MVCKEACRTVAILAHSLGTIFVPLAEAFWSSLIRVVTVKIQVMSSAADRAARVLVALCVDNRLFVQIAESCGARNNQVRKLSLEYLSLACALWRYDVVERHLALVKQVIRSGLVDADGGARKIARLLYLVLHSRVALQGLMDAFFGELEASAQRHISNEQQVPSIELLDLLRLSRDPSCVGELFSGAVPESSNQSTESPPPPFFSISTSTASQQIQTLKTVSIAATSSIVTLHDDSDRFFALGDTVAPNRRMSLSSGAVRLTHRLKTPREEEPEEALRSSSLL